MPPQHNQPSPPQGGGQRPSFTPAAPHFEYNTAPVQHPNGKYAVVPPPAPTNNASSGHNPYEFIVNPNQPKKSGSLLGTGNSFMMRIALIVGVVVILFVGAAMALSSLGPKSITPNMEEIAERQQEIVRIATAGTTAATGQDTQNFAITVGLTVGSSQQQVLVYLAGHKIKLSPKTLALDANPQTDALLTDASSAGTYDTVIVQTLAGQLKTYQALLHTTFLQTTNPTTKKILQSSYDTAGKLLQQAQSLPGGS